MSEGKNQRRYLKETEFQKIICALAARAEKDLADGKIRTASEAERNPE